MSLIYNRIAGRSIERLAALSDGVFAVAMTLLILDIRLPGHETVHSELDLWHLLVDLSPRFLMYLMSFLTLGIFWSGQQTQLNHFDHADRDLAWIHILFLAAVTCIPFSTTLLAEFITYRLALGVYWLNIFLLGALLYASIGYARRAKLIKDELTPDIIAVMCRRITLAQALYAAGALLSIGSTSWSIGFIFLAQLVFAVGPRIGVLARI